ncbi:putative H+-transporting two-sector ATPase chain b precursor, mitochondrial [Meira miltonrushii]|uniref:ATP synthase subunit 4 n=1 Tax=Meira miltonrushii TaxID=1280837 RepID=A0A316VEG5_9BASI|nr:putative H+-transporting two-sector ATPase chain b precursor, mitochondrial [Meira miltonrushii]PWN36047.1 putative H+-transporting two-sector ATPase chain b precursor, mitochondrial [Meira miltonrushii]
MSLRSAAPRAAVLRSAALRPAAPRMAFTASSIVGARGYADKPSPETRASALLVVLPGNSIVTKAGWVTLGTSLSALAVSKELYVANEETVILVAFLVFATFLGRTVSAPYKEWADGQIEKISSILNGARKEHTQAVQSRIDSVSEQRDVVDITKQLYAVAKETAQVEKEAFELQQRTSLAAELKTVLDSWVRYESQEREAEQKLLAKTVIEKVTASLRDEKTQKQILDNAVAEVEALVKSKAV